MTQPSRQLRTNLLRVACAALICFLGLAPDLAAAEPAAKKPFDIPAGSATATLKQFAQQSGVELLYSTDAIAGAKTNAVVGEFTPLAALTRMLAGSELVLTEGKTNRAIAVTRATDPNAPRAAQAKSSDRPSESDKPEIGLVKLGTYEVFGSKLINADIPRTRDDVQPYVVFEREVINSSMATNLEEFFRARLPMNQSSQSNAQGFSGNNSEVNLRGLGSNQTLILLDGRRLPPVGGTSGNTTQPDLNGIPLGMIERIEILPSTASGIYGGGATGGVINIITRKDYAGVEASMNYLNTFDSDAYTRRFELNGSFQLQGGKTQLTFNLSRVDGTALLVQDRDLQQRGRARQLANNPSTLVGPTVSTNGYTTNIRSQNGSNLVLKNGTALNSPITSVPVGYRGPSTDGGAALATNAGKYNLDLPAGITTGREAELLTVPDQQSYGVSLRRRFGDRVEFMVDASRLDNRGTISSGNHTATVTLPVTAPTNPFTTPISVTANAPNLRGQEGSTLNRSDRLLAGLAVKLPRGWSAGLDYVWSESWRPTSIPITVLLGDPDGTGPGLSYTAAVTNGTLDVMRDLNAYPLDYTPYRMPRSNTENAFKLASDEFTLRGSGPVWHLPAGDLMLSASAQYREEEIPSALTTVPRSTSSALSYFWNPRVGLNHRAYYAELHVPVFGATAPDGWKRGLELQVAVRRDESTATMRTPSDSISVAGPDGPFPSVTYFNRRYADTTVTAGFKYSPLRDLTLRASAGTGFLAPSLLQLGSASSLAFPLSFTDPKRGNQAVVELASLQIGGNPDLKPEQSESVSAGLILTPRFLPGFRLSLDYTRIMKTDEIAALFPDQLLPIEDLLPGSIVRAPLTPADQALGYTGGLVQQFDSRNRNIAGKRVTAYDVQAEYTVKTAAWGEFEAYAAATYQPDFSTKPIPGVGFAQFAGTFAQLKWRGNGGLTWKKDRLSLGWNMQYYHSHLVYLFTFTNASRDARILGQGSPTIPSQTYHDISIRYSWGEQPRGWRWLLANTQLTLGVQNVLNTRPPVLATTFVEPGSGYSRIGDPRLARYTINVRRQF